MKTLFLIGATGHVGSHLMAELAPDHAAGRLRVKVATRSADAHAKVAAAGLEPARFDLDAPAGFDAALEGGDTVFLLRPYTIRQLMHGKQVVDAARRTGVSSIVMVGAHGAADTPHPVIGWNMLVEAYAERSGLGWTHLRPNFFMDNLTAQYDRANGLLYNGLSVPVSWIASADIAAVAAGVLRDPAAHASRIYPLASERATPGQIAEAIAAVTGTPCRHASPPRDRVMARLVEQGREPVYAEPLLDYIEAINRGEAPESAEVFDTVETVAGRPPTSLHTFLTQHLTV